MTLRGETDLLLLRTRVTQLEERLDRLEIHFRGRFQAQDGHLDDVTTDFQHVRGRLESLKNHVDAIDKTLEKKGIWDVGENRD
jgi:hypothetical protein